MKKTVCKLLEETKLRFSWMLYELVFTSFCLGLFVLRFFNF